MNWKNRLTNYNFWISLVSAVLLILQAFNFEFDIANLSEIVTAMLGFMVVIGIISNPTKSKAETKLEDSKIQAKTEANTQPQETQIPDELKENVDAMPYNKQDEDNLGAGENDFKVLIEKISSDIALQTGIERKDVADVVNEIINAYEEGEIMLENQINEIECLDENIENEQPDIDVEEIAEQLLEKDGIEIDEKLAEEIEEEYIEYKEMQEDLLRTEDLKDGTHDEQICVDESVTEVVLEESTLANEPNQEIDENINEDPIETSEASNNNTENIISFKIVN